MKTHFLTGMILAAVGLFIRFHISRRRFNRRGIGGLQQFPTYSRFIFTVTLERIIFFIGTLCLLAGLILVAIEGLSAHNLLKMA